MTFLLVMLAVVCSAATGDETITRAYPDGSPLETYQVTEEPGGGKLREGEYTRWYENGEKAATGEYRRGEQHGPWTFFHENGQKRASGHYEKGARTGRWNCWTGDGKFDEAASGVYKITETNLVRGSTFHGQRQGRWRFFRKDGSLAVEGEYVDNRPEGVWKIFHRDGSLDPDFVSGVYEDGKRVGPLPEEPYLAVPERIDDLKDCLHALGPPGVTEKRLSAIESGLLRKWNYASGSTEEELEIELLRYGGDLVPLLLRRLVATDLNHPGEVRTGTRLVQRLLAPLHNGWSFEWRDGNSDEDRAINRTSILRWHTLWEWTRDNPEFLPLVLPFAGRPETQPEVANPLFEERPPMLRSDRSDPFVRPVGSGLSVKNSKLAREELGRALDWLIRHQDPSGYWSAAGFSKRCDKNFCDGAGDPSKNVDVTGLALLALLRDPDPSRRVEHADAITRAVGWLILTQNREKGYWSIPYDVKDPDTGMTYQALSTEFIHGTAQATLALAEAARLYGRGGALHRATQLAIDYSTATRHLDKAWGYPEHPESDQNLYVTGWMTMAQMTARAAGFDVDPKLQQGVQLYIDELTDTNSWRTGDLIKGGYTSRMVEQLSKWPDTMAEAGTALAMVLRLLLDGSTPEEGRALDGGTYLLLKRPPRWDEEAGTIDYRYWLFGSQCLSMMGGDAFTKWRAALTDAVLKTQRQEGCELGSWDPQFDVWGETGGRVYSTAILALTLEFAYGETSELKGF